MAVFVNRLVCFAMAFLVVCALHAQEKSRPGYASFFVGTGIPHGGDIGMNLEVGINQISLFGTLGYRFARSDLGFDTLSNSPMASPQLVPVRIDSSLNTSFGIRFNFLNDKYFKPRIGMQVGWITNYYDRRIDPLPEANYNPVVSGFSFHGGVEFEAPLLISLDMVVAPRGLIFNSEDHPYFRNVHVGFSVGIGIPLEDFISDSFNRKRSKPSKVKFDY